MADYEDINDEGKGSTAMATAIRVAGGKEGEGGKGHGIGDKGDMQQRRQR